MIFYKNIFISAILSAIILLAIVAFIIYYYKDQEVYPPSVSNCPDYYNVDSESNECVNTGVWQLDNTEMCERLDFSEDKYLVPGTDSTSGLCAKKNKANECNITWDGLTNNSTICAKKKT